MSSILYINLSFAFEAHIGRAFWSAAARVRPHQTPPTCAITPPALARKRYLETELDLVEVPTVTVPGGQLSDSVD